MTLDAGFSDPAARRIPPEADGIARDMRPPA